MDYARWPWHDIGAFAGLVLAVNARHSSSAAGTRVIQAGSIGGQLAVIWSKVPSVIERMIFAGTSQRET